MRLLILFGLFVTTLFAHELAIVSNRYFPLSTLNSYQTKEIFLKRIDYIKDIKLIPINLSYQHSLRKFFTKKILKMPVNKLRQHWTRLHYKGKPPPIVQNSINSAIAFVREVNGSVTYIPISKTPDDLKILYKITK